MGLSDPPVPSETPDLEFLFTNSKGQVIFTNQAFLKGLGDHFAYTVKGESLKTILPVDDSSFHELLEMVKQRNHIANLSVPFRRETENPIKANCFAVATWDVGGGFIGMDLVCDPSPREHENEKQSSLIGGTLFESWGHIATGFLCAAVSYLLYTWTIWQGTYQVAPTANVDILSLVINVLYVMFYVLVAMGLFRHYYIIKAP